MRPLNTCEKCGPHSTNISTTCDVVSSITLPLSQHLLNYSMDYGGEKPLQECELPIDPIVIGFILVWIVVRFSFWGITTDFNIDDSYPQQNTLKEFYRSDFSSKNESS